MASAPSNVPFAPLVPGLGLVLPPNIIPSSFPNFGKLPAEIRTEIWKFYLKKRNRRIVQVRFAKDGRQNGYRMIADIPPLLHTCREARFEAKKLYSIAFGLGRDAQSKAYFNFEVDTLYFSKDSSARQRDLFLLREPVASIEQVKNLAVQRNVYLSLLSGGSHEGLHTGILVFKMLRELTVLRKHVASNSTCSGGCVHNVPCFSHGKDVTCVWGPQDAEFLANMEYRKVKAESDYSHTMSLAKNDVIQAGLTEWTNGFNPKVVAKWLCENGIAVNRKHL